MGRTAVAPAGISSRSSGRNRPRADPAGRDPSTSPCSRAAASSRGRFEGAVLEERALAREQQARQAREAGQARQGAEAESPQGEGRARSEDRRAQGTETAERAQAEGSESQGRARQQQGSYRRLEDRRLSACRGTCLEQRLGRAAASRA